LGKEEGGGAGVEVLRGPAGVPDDARRLSSGLGLGVQVPGHRLLLHRAHEYDAVHVPATERRVKTVCPYERPVGAGTPGGHWRGHRGDTRGTPGGHWRGHRGDTGGDTGGSHGEVGDEGPLGDLHVEADALRLGA